MKAMLEGFMNVREAAQEIGVTPGRVRQMLVDGDIVGVQANPRAWMIHEDEVARVAKQKYTTGRPRSGRK
jgi:hypothetical protein